MTCFITEIAVIGGTTVKTRQALAHAAFSQHGTVRSRRSPTTSSRLSESSSRTWRLFPPVLLMAPSARALRYGENPHQQARF